MGAEVSRKVHDFLLKTRNRLQPLLVTVLLQPVDVQLRRSVLFTFRGQRDSQSSVCRSLHVYDRSETIRTASKAPPILDQITLVAYGWVLVPP